MKRRVIAAETVEDAEALDMNAWLSLPAAVQDQIVSAYLGDKARGRSAQPAVTYCKRGHAQVGDNIYTTPRGQKRCRGCMREYNVQQTLRRQR